MWKDHRIDRSFDQQTDDIDTGIETLDVEPLAPKAACSSILSLCNALRTAD
jgi:hypothetical protein